MQFRVAAAAVVALMTASVAHAQIVVDGNLDKAYGSAKSSVTYSSTAEESNFGDPGTSTDAESYDIYLASAASNVYGYIKATGDGKAVASFANLYFDLDPQNGNGSDLGFEITNDRAFVAGGDGTYAPADLQVATNSTDGSIEFAIPNVDFEEPIAGLSGYPNASFPTGGDDVTLRLSQSLGYSVAGGPNYGPDRLGSVTIGGAAVSAAPEPSSWALLLAGVGLLGAALRSAVARPRRATVAI